jgi:hypothetical protein
MAQHDSVGEGWDERKIAIFFNERNNIVNGQEEVPMTRSKHFEHAYIVLSTMTKIKLIFHINLYVFNIHTKIPNGTNKLYYVKRLAVFQNEPFRIPYG